MRIKNAKQNRMERFNSKYNILTDGIDTNIMNDKKIRNDKYPFIFQSRLDENLSY